MKMGGSFNLTKLSLPPSSLPVRVRTQIGIFGMVTNCPDSTAFTNWESS